MRVQPGEHMSIHIGINHLTKYRYDRPVSLSPHVLRLRPAPHCRTPIQSYSLRIVPENCFINWQQDPFGNHLARLVIPEPTEEFSIEVDLVANLTVYNPFDFFLEPSAERIPFRYEELLAKELSPYFELGERGPLLQRWISTVDRNARPTVDFLVSLNRRLQADIRYLIRHEPGVQSCEESLSLKSGSCRDSAWLLVQILRHLGMAARFVSGYLVQLTADTRALDGPSGPEMDFTDLHAWTEVYVPGAGWIGLDPTSGLMAGEGHIPLACAPDPQSAAAVTGYATEAKAELYFHNQVRRIHEDPRVTRPYTAEQWSVIDSLGQHVDTALESLDVRLTMGGEPTFVSVDDMESAEWNIDAMGPTKRLRAGDLLRRLRRRFAPHGVLHYGQGKWYPGEALPRWALGCFWRADDQPIWFEPSLLAEESRDHGIGLAEAKRFIEKLADNLLLVPDHIRPGYEDALYYLWKEGTLPINVDPLRAESSDAEERRRLATLLSRGLGIPTGYALPLAWNETHDAWTSSSWTFRRERMNLVPGSSAMGYRLPLDSLQWTPTEEHDLKIARDPFAPRAPLADALPPQRQGVHTPIAQHPVAGGNGAAPPALDSSAAPDSTRFVRTALCAEAREGRLYIFLPPVRLLEPWIELIHAIEKTATTLDMPVVLEGYEPPRDPRLRRLLITPDPGVIEVNVHPASSWDELTANTQTLYEEARECRLATEKFMLDGRHTGTGGGNHVTLGAANAADSPLLRRPDLVKSLVTYWQNHPSLSYLFSGLFIGPTSQAPRIDEARNDALYELEIALQQVPEGETLQPWLVDRIFRHLLVDVTGNTHRTELCVDKLYSPDGPAGRLGLLEVRAFEMPPHWQMSSVQQLLLRAIVARCWASPYPHPLIRWGTALHDRFMLPHHLWEDLREVVCDLDRAGFTLSLDWFAPFFEFRFPRYGVARTGDIEIELRMAVEPWHVLGEEVSSSGTSRYVDSSVERVQVKVRGMIEERHAVACNGRRVPLRSTGRSGEYVAGVRYRAWRPPSALHPTVPIDAPLVLDLVDLFNRCSILGCTYHVGHPGGRHYDVFPVNANEAAARRGSRFWPYGHTPGRMTPPPEETSLEHPYTLDLRRSEK